MHTPLTVRVDDGVTPRVVTRHVRGLSFRKTAPGGHHSASMRLNLPLGTFDELGPADKVYIDDGRTGRTVWEGYPENPGQEAGAAGEGFDLSAMGGMVLAQDRSTPVVFIDRTITDDLWPRMDNSHANQVTDSLFTGDGVTSPTGPTLLLQFSQGWAISNLARGSRTYRGIERARQRLLDCRAEVHSGKDSASYQFNLVITEGGFVYEETNTLFLNTTINGATIDAQAVTDFPLGRDGVQLRLMYQGGATNVADVLTWGKFVNPSVRALLSNANGTDDMSPTSYTAVTATEVVAHLLGGGLLPQLDGAGARVDATSTLISQLAYHDGATPRRILDDLALWEPDFLWEVGESTAAGKHRFAYRAWPTTPRYEISTRDGYSAPGGDADLCNRVIVYWTDPQGERQSTVVTSTVPELGSRTRDAAPVTLPEGQGAADNAQRVGEMVLAAKARPPRAARATVTRPILDHLRGGLVMPWEIEPGYLVRVRETGDDLRLTEVTYSDESTSAALTLDEPQRTVEQMVAALAARR